MGSQFYQKKKNNQFLFRCVHFISFRTRNGWMWFEMFKKYCDAAGFHDGENAACQPNFM